MEGPSHDQGQLAAFLGLQELVFIHKGRMKIWESFVYMKDTQ